MLLKILLWVFPNLSFALLTVKCQKDDNKFSGLIRSLETAGYVHPLFSIDLFKNYLNTQSRVLTLSSREVLVSAFDIVTEKAKEEFFWRVNVLNDLTVKNNLRHLSLCSFHEKLGVLVRFIPPQHENNFFFQRSPLSGSFRLELYARLGKNLVQVDDMDGYYHELSSNDVWMTADNPKTVRLYNYSQLRRKPLNISEYGPYYAAFQRDYPNRNMTKDYCKVQYRVLLECLESSYRDSNRGASFVPLPPLAERLLKNIFLFDLTLQDLTKLFYNIFSEGDRSRAQTSQQGSVVLRRATQSQSRNDVKSRQAKTRSYHQEQVNIQEDVTVQAPFPLASSSIMTKLSVRNSIRKPTFLKPWKNI